MKPPSQTSGYSGRPLAAKLGIKPHMRLAVVNAPYNYFDLLQPLQDDLQWIDLPWLNSEQAESTDAVHATAPLSSVEGLSFIHLFAFNQAELHTHFARLKDALAPDGMLWVSWPKRAAKLDTDLSDAVVREFGLSQGLVDVKVAAIDATWSGLKFVYRVADRPAVRARRDR